MDVNVAWKMNQAGTRLRNRWEGAWKGRVAMGTVSVAANVTVRILRQALKRGKIVRRRPAGSMCVVVSTRVRNGRNDQIASIAMVAFKEENGYGCAGMNRRRANEQLGVRRREPSTTKNPVCSSLLPKASDAHGAS